MPRAVITVNTSDSERTEKYLLVQNIIALKRASASSILLPNPEQEYIEERTLGGCSPGHMEDLAANVFHSTVERKLAVLGLFRESFFPYPER